MRSRSRSRSRWVRPTLVACLAWGCGPEGGTDTESDGTSGTSDGATGTDDSADDAATETSGTDTSETGDTDTESTADADDATSGTDTSETGDTAGVTDETGDLTEEGLCSISDGIWDDGACGHYVCGVPNACEALIPGCDCGPGRTFEIGFGCVEDLTCEGAISFPCADGLPCTVDVEYCQITHPGPGGPTQSSCPPMPRECAVAPSCACLESIDIVGPESDCSVGLEGGITVESFLP